VQFVWSDACQEAFETLKRALTTAPVLAHFRQDRDIELLIDGSLVGIGAVLHQRDENNQLRVIKYASRVLNQHERNYSVTEIETLAVLFAFNKFRQYVYLQNIKVITDHCALCNLLNTRSLQSPRLTRWLAHLLDYKLKIVYAS
jgi:hypothetical protein